MTLVLLAAGLVLLLGGGEALVRGAVAVAHRLGVSPVVAGLVLVGFGTSSPELVTSLTAALSGAPAIAVGNVVGSNICNILLILGVTALLFPVDIDRRAFARDGTMLALATAAGIGVALMGVVPRAVGLALVAAVVAYVVYTYRQERRVHSPAEAVYSEEAALLTSPSLGLWGGLAMALAGLIAVVVGADLLVDAATTLARAAGVSEAVIGLTIVALGTSLPELATAVMAGLKKQPEVAFGNVVGSNIFNILFILGTTATVQPIAVPAEIVRFDIWVMLAATAAMFLVVRTGFRVTRREGVALLLGYAAYIGVLAQTSL
ncbi:MAG: calcium/sodium antiporter [Alphaproteobacteria bacterium]